jgi:hypothetical protein
MIGLRATAQRLCDRMANALQERASTAPWTDANAETIARALWRRESAGEATSLRQVHMVTGICQPAALRAVRELDRAGMIVIEDDLDDALESRIVMTDRLRVRLKAGITSDRA